MSQSGRYTSGERETQRVGDAYRESRAKSEREEIEIWRPLIWE